MREAEYITMLDPLQDKYGRIMGAVLYIPAFLGETFWSASILSALGATLTVILGLEMNVSVIVSACIAVGYTFFGGLYSVAYTDVVQLICIAIGLWLTVPFCLSHDHVAAISSTQSEWVGSLGGAKVGKWIDYAMLLVSWIILIRFCVLKNARKSISIHNIFFFLFLDFYLFLSPIIYLAIRFESKSDLKFLLDLWWYPMASIFPTCSFIQIRSSCSSLVICCCLRMYCVGYPSCSHRSCCQICQ